MYTQFADDEGILTETDALTEVDTQTYVRLCK